MTYRERREGRAERLRDWAAKRQRDAAATLKAGEPFTSDIAFNTQPGHIPFRARLIAREDRAFESMRKAERMTSRADGIEDQLERSIYSDDEDAVEKLEARIAGLEAEREHVKKVNASIRAYERKTKKANRDLTAADMIECGVTPADVSRFSPEWHGWRYPAYVLQNLGGNISRNRERLAGLKLREAQAARVKEALEAETLREVYSEPATPPDPVGINSVLSAIARAD